MKLTQRQSGGQMLGISNARRCTPAWNRSKRSNRAPAALGGIDVLDHLAKEPPFDHPDTDFFFRAPTAGDARSPALRHFTHDEGISRSPAGRQAQDDAVRVLMERLPAR